MRGALDARRAACGRVQQRVPAGLRRASGVRDGVHRLRRHGLVAKDSAALFVDGRYILQAPRQVDTQIFEVLQVGKAKVGEWLAKTLKPGATIGYDPKLHPPGTIDDLAQELAARRIKLKPLASNPVDRVWGKARPAPPQGAVDRAPPQVRGQIRRGQAWRDPGHPEEGRPGRRRPHLPALDLLAPQHPRLGRGAQSAGSGVCHRAGERQGGAVHRPGQDRPRGQGASGAAGQAQRTRGPGRASDGPEDRPARPSA